MTHEYFNGKYYANTVQVRSLDDDVLAEATIDADEPRQQVTVYGNWPEKMAEEIASKTLAWRQQASVAVEWDGER